MTRPVALDEYPIHQTPLSLRYVGTSDRNFYDRCYFNAHDRTGDVFFISGMGVYPNLGIADAYAVVRIEDTQHVVRFSDVLDDRSLDATVGAYRVEVQEPLQRIRLVCDTPDLGLAFDMTWDGSFPAVMEMHHELRAGPRAILDASRFAQLGSWSGTITVDGSDITVTPDVWVGSRDRSWGIRPVGETEPPGRQGDEPREGFWWLYVPMRFDDFATIVILQEDPDGFRSLNDATLVRPDGSVEQLGWPEYEFTYTPGTRVPERCLLHLTRRGGKPMDIDVSSLGFIPLHIGCGYGGDPDWTHGQWKGRAFAEGARYDLNDPAVAGRVPFGVIDHVGRALCDGQEGWGLFEHATIGRHDPTGFADFLSVAP